MTPATGRCSTRCSATPSCAPQWRQAPCTRSGHHAYLGGLLSTPSPSPRSPRSWRCCTARLNSDLLITAAIVHDLGKTREFSYGAAIELSEEGRLLGHIQLGMALLTARAAGVLDAAQTLALGHCVLSHHGPDGTPAGRFQSVEALALYRLNALDATVKGALEHGL